MMYYLLLQNNRCIVDLTNNLAVHYPESSVWRTGGDNYPRKAPLLTSRWVVFVNLHEKKMVRQIEQAKVLEQIAHFVFITSNKSGIVQKLLAQNKIVFETINNIDVTEEVMLSYIQSNLKVSKTIAKRVLIKSKRYEPSVIKNVETLLVLNQKQLTASLVDRYLGDSNIVGFGYLYKFILVGEGEYKSILELVYQYRYHSAVLCRYIINRLERDIALFNEILDGNLTRENYIMYSTEHGIPYYQLQQVLLLFNRISLEELYAKMMVFKQLSKGDCVDFIMKGCKK